MGALFVVYANQRRLTLLSKIGVILTGVARYLRRSVTCRVGMQWIE